MRIIKKIELTVCVVLLALAGCFGTAHAETMFMTTPDNQIRMQWHNATAADILKAMAEKANKKIEVNDSIQQQRLAAAAIEAATYDDLFAGVLENAEYEIIGDGMNEVISISVLNGFPLATEPAPNPAVQKSAGTGGAGSVTTTNASVPALPTMPYVPTDMNSGKETQSLDELQRQRAAQQNAVFYYYATGTKPETK